MDYIAIWNVSHEGKTYTPGEIVKMSEEAAKRLIRLGAVKEAAPAPAAPEAEPEEAADELPETGAEPEAEDFDDAEDATEEDLSDIGELAGVVTQPKEDKPAKRGRKKGA